MQHNIFTELPDSDQSALRALGRERTLAAGEVLYREGEDFSGQIFLLQEGQMALIRTAGDTRLRPPGYLLGMSSYFTGEPFSATAMARSPSTLLAIEADALNALEQQRPRLADALNRMIALSLGERRRRSGTGTLTQAVSGLMSTPVLACAADTPLQDTVREMLARNVGSMIVDGTPPSAVTYRSAARVLSEERVHPAAAADAAEPIAVVEPNAPVWKVQELLRGRSGKHVLVAHGRDLQGVVSLADIAALIQGSIASLAAQIQGARDLDALHQQFQGLHHIAARLLDSNRRASNAVASLSEVHLAIQRRCIQLTETQLLDQGLGPAPSTYALIIMGSGGRREMMLDPDQDNALLLPQGVSKGDEASAWFEAFANALNENLARCGYTLCEGDIMARNPSYRKSLQDWKAQVDFVAVRPGSRAARWASIMFDFTLQHGDPALVSTLREHVCDTMQNKPKLLELMVEDDAQGRAPISWFNRLIATGEREGKEVIDVKRNGLRMISNASRILALAHGIPASGTRDRLRGLTRLGVLSADFASTITDAFDDLLAIVISHQVDRRRANLPLDKEVAPGDLSTSRRESLRVAMRAVKRLQDFVQGHLGNL